MLLSAKEQQEINELAQQFEQTSGAQAVAAVVGKADDYPDIPWKAFALGASLAAMAVVADEFIHPDWASIHTPLRDVAVILAAGVLTALLSMYVAVFARLFLSRERAAGEIRQYAQGIFLQREMFRTAERVGILILVCRFERKVYILPDSGIARHLAQGELDAVIAAMAPHLAQWRPVDAFRAGFEALAALLAHKHFRPQAHGNELQDGTVVEEGSS
jgi:putative membrane protein